MFKAAVLTVSDRSSQGLRTDEGGPLVAKLLEEAGCFAIVLEKIPAGLAGKVAAMLTIPVIGIGAGGDMDGQVLVVQDMLGMNKGFSPRYLRRYMDMYDLMTEAFKQYIYDVKSCDFPNEKEQYE